MSENNKAREKWHQAYLLRRAGMKESYLILRNAWFTEGGILEDSSMIFLTDDFLE